MSCKQRQLKATFELYPFSSAKSCPDLFYSYTTTDGEVQTADTNCLAISTLIDNWLQSILWHENKIGTVSTASETEAVALADDDDEDDVEEKKHPQCPGQIPWLRSKLKTAWRSIYSRT